MLEVPHYHIYSYATEPQLQTRITLAQNRSIRSNGLEQKTHKQANIPATGFLINTLKTCAVQKAVLQQNIFT